MIQTIKVLKNKENPSVSIEKGDSIEKCYYVNEFGLEGGIVREKVYQIHFIEQWKYWSFNTQQERDRIYEKIKPYFEFKEVEEFKID